MGRQHRKKDPLRPSFLRVYFGLLVFLHEFLHCLLFSHYTFKTMLYYLYKGWKGQYSGRMCWPHLTIFLPKRD